MATIASKLLEKAEFGRFQKENQEALNTLDKEKRNLRIKRKLKEAQTRSKQVKVKFKEPPHGEYSEEGISDLREAKVKVGNQVFPTRVTFRYDPFFTEKNIGVYSIFSTKPIKPKEDLPWYAKQYADTKNKTFKPSQLKQVLEAVKKRYPKAEMIFGDRISGTRARSSDGSGLQIIHLKKLRKRGGLLGLGLSLKEAIQAGKAAYDAKEGKM